MLKANTTSDLSSRSCCRGFRSGEIVLDNNSNAERSDPVEGGPTDERADHLTDSDDVEVS